MARRATLLLIAWTLAAGCTRPPDSEPRATEPQHPRVARLDELSAPQVNQLDRQRTLFILAVGMLEQHGPHLPIGSDTFGVVFEASRVAVRVAQQLPDWTVVLMPAVNYGEGGANEIGGILTHPGTYGIRQTTLRALIADIGGQIAQNGFRWLFVASGHGAPAHNLAIDEATDFVSETFGVSMLPVTTIFRTDAAIQARLAAIQARHFPEADRTRWGLDVHAGVAETSALLALRPDLVDSGYQALAPYAASSQDDLAATARKPGWPGYFSAPAEATAAYGRDLEAWWVDGLSELIVRATKGETLRARPRPREALPPQVQQFLAPALANEKAFEAKLNAWLAARSQ